MLFVALVVFLPLVTAFNVAEHLANASPYHKAPAVPNLKDTLPADCQVQQVSVLHRHGSRFPTKAKLSTITNLVKKLASKVDVIKQAKLPAELAFLKDGYTSTLGTDDLTPPGRADMFEHGVSFRLKYPNLNADAILAGSEARIVESAGWFGQGYFGPDWATKSQLLRIVNESDRVTPSYISPINACPSWRNASLIGVNADRAWSNIYLPQVANRLNKLIPGLDLSTDEALGAINACAYDLAANRTSPWCGVFEQSEIEGFEYENDLYFDGAFGYGLPGNMPLTLGALYVDELVARLNDTSQNAHKMYLDFGHDTSITLALAGFGLAKDATDLTQSTKEIKKDRKWRTSDQVPFAAQMVWEKFTCISAFTGPQIRLILNESPFPLVTCANMNKEYGTCSLEDFVKANAAAAALKFGDSNWKSICGTPTSH